METCHLVPSKHRLSNSGLEDTENAEAKEIQAVGRCGGKEGSRREDKIYRRGARHMTDVFYGPVISKICIRNCSPLGKAKHLIAALLPPFGLCPLPGHNGRSTTVPRQLCP